MIPFKVISVCFVVFAFGATCSAAPEMSMTSSWNHDAAGNTLFPAELQESIKHFTHEVEKSFKSFSKNFEFMFKNLDGVFRNTVEKGFVNMATWAMDIVGRLEFLIMADGSHFLTPVSGKPELEQEYKTVAIAVSKLLRNLKTMEHTDKLITNATKKVITEDMERHVTEMKSSLPEKVLRTILHSYIEAMDHMFEADSELATEYKKMKTEAKKEVKKNPKMEGPLFKFWEANHEFPDEKEIKMFLHDKVVVCEAFANKLFMKHSVKNFGMVFNSTSHHRFTLGRAMIHKAQSSGFDSKVNHVYHEALMKAGSVEYISEDDDVISDVLFGWIEKGLEADKTLHKEIHTLMKQIEGSTIYDFDMLRIDFAPL